MRRIIAVFFALTTSLALSGCQTAVDPKADEADRAVAEAKLQEMLAVKARKAQELENQRRIAQEREAARLAEAQKPHYAPTRLAYAAKQRNWANITVPDLNVQAVFNSTWTDDRLNYRVALLGQKVAIDTFLGNYRSYGINFADQSGNKIFEFPIDRDGFAWAPPGFNGGIPTVELRGAVPMDLPTYEQSVQWNLTWAL